jgi:hypothetical protein
MPREHNEEWQTTNDNKSENWEIDNLGIDIMHRIISKESENGKMI